MADDILKLYWLFYQGDREAIYQHYIEKRARPELQVTAQGRPIEDEVLMPMYQFRMRNVIRDIIQKRVEFMPRSFTVQVMVGDSEFTPLTDLLKQTLSGRIFDNRTVDQILPLVYLYQEIWGFVCLKFFTTTVGAEPRVTVWPSTEVDIYTSPSNVLEITGYSRKYETYQFGDKVPVKHQYEDFVDGKQYISRIDGKPSKTFKHAWSTVPVARILNEPAIDNPYGVSTVASLIDAQTDINDAETKRARVTKYNAFQVWSPKQAPLGKAPSDRITIWPGAFSPIPIESAGGNVVTAPLESEIDDAMVHIYEIGKVMRPIKDKTSMGQVSGDALERMLIPLIMATRQKADEVAQGLETIFTLILESIQERRDFTVKVEFSQVDFKDDAYKLQLATWLMSNNFGKEALLALDFDEKTAETMLKDKEERDAQRRAQEKADEEARIAEDYAAWLASEGNLNGNPPIAKPPAGEQ